MSTANDWLILVDEHDNTIGHAQKMYAHEHNLLHRAFSVMLLDQNDPNQCLLQQRQLDKYHCPGLWTNTCCSHPLPNEPTAEAARRRLQQELNLNNLPDLNYLGSFIYHAAFDNGLHEHELDHVFVGTIAPVAIHFNREEINAVKWMDIRVLQQALATHPEHYSPWLAGVLQVMSMRCD